jgi:hypothetical protein
MKSSRPLALLVGAISLIVLLFALWQVSRGAGVAGFLVTAPCASGPAPIGTADAPPACASPRQRLAANTAFYVRTDGNDVTCTGLTDAPYASGSYPQACAWATPQHANDVIRSSYDLALFQVKVLIGRGTYSSNGHGLNINGPYVGSSPSRADYPGPGVCPVIFSGATQIASDVTISSETKDAVLVADGAYVCFENMTLTAPSGSDLHVGFAIANYANINFGPAGRSWLWSGHLSVSENFGDFAVTGDARSGFEASYQSALWFKPGATIRIAADIRVAQFALADRGGEISFNNIRIDLGGHAVDGKRFAVTNNSAIITGANSLTYLPGNAAGSVDSGSSYDGRSLAAQAAYSYEVPSDAFAITLDDNAWHTILDPATALASGTITMPPNPVDGMLVDIRTSQAIASLKLAANVGQSMKAAPSALAAGGTLSCIYRGTNATWYC